jgi:hypothetical protein
VRVLCFVLAGCGWLPADQPAKPQAIERVDEDRARLAHTWTIASHLVGKQSAVSDADAAELHGRTIAIDVGYTTPWQGSCEEAARVRRDRVLADVIADHDLDALHRQQARKFGLTDELVEYQLSCPGTNRIPPLVIFVAGPRAITCFGGTCYLLQR